MKKNIVYILGGAAAIYFLFMRSKKTNLTSSAMPVTPDQELAPAFVQTSSKTPYISNRSRTRKKAISPISDMMSVANEMRMDSDMAVDPGSPMQPDSAAPIVLSRRDARSQARTVKADVRAAGGSGREARQAARSVRRDARAVRRMGEISVLF